MHITSKPALILTNAMSSSAPWAVPFTADNTRPGDFHVSAGETVRVAMMNQTNWFRYLDCGSFHMLELQSKGNGLAMVIALPKAVDGLALVEAELTAEKFET
jgi:serine protease inhibitor